MLRREVRRSCDPVRTAETRVDDVSQETRTMTRVISCLVVFIPVDLCLLEPEYSG